MTDAVEPLPHDVDEFLRTVGDERRRAEGFRLKELFEHSTELPAELWDGGIIGFGREDADGPQPPTGSTFVVGFSLEEEQLVLHGLHSEQEDPDRALLSGLGEYRVSDGRILVERLDDIDQAVLETLARNVVAAPRRADRA